MSSVEKDIRKALKEDKIIMGSKSVIRGLKNNAFAEVVFAENCPDETRGDIDRYARLAGIETKPFAGNSSQLGQVCGKPFNILLIGIMK